MQLLPHLALLMEGEKFYLKECLFMSNIWYLSPSRQPENVGINGYGTEQEQMYILTDAITPHLDRCGVSFHVADPEETLAQRCRESNDMEAFYHLALHSNAGGNGKAWGPIAFYYSAGQPLAEKLSANLLALGQANNRSSNVQQNTDLYELRNAAAPAVLLEVDFHDSAVGVEFLTTRRNEIAQAIARAIVEVDGKQWIDPSAGKENYKQQVITLGLMKPNAQGNYRWDEPMTREEAAQALISLKTLLEKG